MIRAAIKRGTGRRSIFMEEILKKQYEWTKEYTEMANKK